MKSRAFLTVLALVAVGLMAPISASANCGREMDRDGDQTEFEGTSASIVESSFLAPAGFDAESSESMSDRDSDRDAYTDQSSPTESDQDYSNSPLSESYQNYQGSTMSPKEGQDYSIRLIDAEIDLDTDDDDVDLDAPDIDVPDLDLPGTDDGDIDIDVDVI